MLPMTPEVVVVLVDAAVDAERVDDDEGVVCLRGLGRVAVAVLATELLRDRCGTSPGSSSSHSALIRSFFPVDGRTVAARTDFRRFVLASRGGRSTYSGIEGTVENRRCFLPSRAQSSSVYVVDVDVLALDDWRESSVSVLLEAAEGGSGGRCLSLSMGRMAAMIRESRCMEFVGVESGV